MAPPILVSVGVSVIGWFKLDKWRVHEVLSKHSGMHQYNICSFSVLILQTHLILAFSSTEYQSDASVK